MKIELGKSENDYYLYVDNKAQLIPAKMGETQAEYANRAFRKFDKVVELYMGEKNEKIEILKTVII